MKLNKIILIILIISILFESSILAYGYINADEVNCNFLWCEFTKTNTFSEVTSNSKCFINGEEINCSDFGHGNWCKDGICERNGVCPGANKTKTISECIHDEVLKKKET